jgi:hypothetical protein
MPEHPEDTRLLAALAEALSRDTPEAPPPEGLASLHAAVDRRAMGQLHPEPAPPFGWVPGPLANLRWRRPAGVAAILAGSVVAGGGVAFASGAPVPPPIRELATHLGLPVTPQPVVNVHNTESSLSKALVETPTGNGGITGTANSSVSHYAGTLRQQVSELTPSQRQDEDTKAQHLLDQAASQDHQGPDATHPGRDRNRQGNSGKNQNGQNQNGQNQNGQGGNQHSRSGTQHGSTGTTHPSSQSPSDSNQNRQGAGGTGIRFDLPGSHISTTTSAAQPQRRGDNNDNG